MDTADKIDKALDIILGLLILMQDLAGISDEELAARTKAAEQRTDDLLNQLK